MRILGVVAVLVLVAVAATYARYESLHPCNWLQRDTQLRTGLPSLVVEAKIRAGFLADGITAPDAYDCLRAWWRLKSNGRPEG